VPIRGRQEGKNQGGSGQSPDEIDDILEENAEEFVKSYVQRGGQ
jgi:ubiquitin-like protein Pup